LISTKLPYPIHETRVSKLVFKFWVCCTHSSKFLSLKIKQKTMYSLTHIGCTTSRQTIQLTNYQTKTFADFLNYFSVFILYSLMKNACLEHKMQPTFAYSLSRSRYNTELKSVIVKARESLIERYMCER